MRKLSYLFALCLVALILVPACNFNCSLMGCSSKGLIEDLKKKAKDAGGEVIDLKCDEDIDWKKGKTFQCTGKIGGAPFSWTVSITDDSCGLHYEMNK